MAAALYYPSPFKLYVHQDYRLKNIEIRSYISFLILNIPPINASWFSDGTYQELEQHLCIKFPQFTFAIKQKTKPEFITSQIIQGKFLIEDDYFYVSDVSCSSATKQVNLFLLSVSSHKSLIGNKIAGNQEYLILKFANAENNKVKIIEVENNYISD